MFVNPNSVESIILVLSHIGKKARIARYCNPDSSENRNIRFWTCVCCDGLPHGLVRKVKEEYFICTQCGEGMLGLDATQHHDKSSHTPNGSTYFLEFDWVLLICGDGHYEMNLMKSFMEMNWNIFMKSLVQIMGFKSEKAQYSALNCSDNHKSWQLLMIFHLGSVLELVRPYVEKCLIEQKETTPEGYISFVKSKETNSNYLFLFEMTCRYSQSIINTRMALRRNNYQLLETAKWMSKELFHGRNHAKYQDIEMYESFVRQILPAEVRQLTSHHCSISKSGHLNKGQGYDLILKEENKQVKSWLKGGIPSDKIWLATCRNHQSLKHIKKTVLNATGCSLDASGGSKEIKIDEAITEWRLLLRQNGYIFDEKHGPVLTSIFGDVLDQGLLQFKEEANRKRGYRMMNMLLH